MEGFKIRMKVEYSQLKSKVDSLQSFISKQERERTVSDEEYGLLISQLNYMQQYLLILKQRCEIHSIDI